jgi:hypothetical protein
MTYPQTGKLYTHWKYGQVFMVLSEDHYSVTVHNLTEGKQFLIPIENFKRMWRHLGGTHE